MSNLLKEGAIFIADSHYPHHGDEFLQILKDLDEKKRTTPQLFLMGDIFDLLFGHNNYIKTFSQGAISLLQKLSNSLDITYLEGNHDFCLKELFPNIKVYKREEQPIHFKLNKQNVYLSHGDKYETKFGFNCYSKIVRNKITLVALRRWEKKIIDHRMKKLNVKNICGDFKAYPSKFNAIISHYPKNSLIIEGHFHQAIFYKNYISLPSLACHKQVAVIKNGVIEFINIENI